jgi:Pentapeptide repeats (8 copies)
MTRASDARPSVDRLRRVTQRRSERPAAVWVALLVLGGIAVLAGCTYVLPRVLVPDRSAASLAAVADAAKRLELEDARLKQRNDVRTTLLQGLAGAVVAIGLSLTWRQIRVNQEGQITERFNKAIDHLGGDKLDLRLGGIYALERIARNSKDDRDTIAEILTAFVRQRSPWPPSQRGQYRDDFPIHEQPGLRTRAADIQAALTVLGRGGFTRQGALRLDLAGVDLRKAVLYDAHLEGANLGRAHLEGANLGNARLEGAFLARAHLEGAYLHDVHLKDADLTRADLKGANLHGADLEGANLRHAELKSATFVNADLKGANLRGAGLEGVDLDSADLQRADLRGARLSHANLSAPSWNYMGVSSA